MYQSTSVTSLTFIAFAVEFSNRYTASFGKFKRCSQQFTYLDANRNFGFTTEFVKGSNRFGFRGSRLGICFCYWRETSRDIELSTDSC